MPLDSLKYKKLCTGLFSLGVLSERISNVEKMYRARPRGYSPINAIRVWFLYSTLELGSITHIYTRYSSVHVPRERVGLLPDQLCGACGPLPKTLTLIQEPNLRFSPPVLTWKGSLFSKTYKCEVKMAGYSPSSLFACLWTETESRSISSLKRNEAKSSRLDRAWSLKDLIYSFRGNFSCGTRRVVPCGQDSFISCLLGLPITAQDLIHLGRSRSSGHIIKAIFKNNLKDRKSCVPKPHVHAFYILNFRGQIAIPRTQNGAQMPHPRVILSDDMALHVLKKITYRTELYVTWKRYFSSNVNDGHDFLLKFLLINLTKRRNCAQFGFSKMCHPKS